jgi:hypothetical protein
MALINPGASARGRPFHLGFKTSVISLFVAIVLVIGLTQETSVSMNSRGQA